MNIGQTVQFLGVITGIIAFASLIYAISIKSESIFKLARYLAALQTFFITLAVLALLHALVGSDFRFLYVASYTDRSLPLVYKLSALWAGQSGSMLFWSFLASICASVELFRLRSGSLNYQSYILMVIVFTATFFLFLCTAVTPLFEMLVFTPNDGRGLNPMLQNPGMMIHPPLLYIGFVGFTVTFAHAFSALCNHDVSSVWIKRTRIWTLITWVFLTAGIVLGAWWAYVELGWGGYWAWDPVENASLFPWITATAFIHAAIMYERKDKLRGWGFFLILITFELTIFGTFLTRSGIMTDSVHSFGESPLGMYFIFFIVLTEAAFLIIVFKNRGILEDKADFNFTSKEGVFFVGLLCFAALTIALIFYTMLPVFSELFGSKISMGQRPYNVVSVVFFTVIFFMASFAPALTYGETKSSQFLKTYIPAFILAVLITAFPIILGFTKAESVVLTFATSIMLSVFLITLVKSVYKAGIGILLKNKRYAGAVIVHIGLAILSYGVIYSAFYNTELEKNTSFSSVVNFGRYSVSVGELMQENTANYSSDYIPLYVETEGGFLTNLYPEIRMYNNNDHVYGEVAYYSLPRGDIYAILQGFDTKENLVSLKLIFQPLIIWIWVGSIMMCLGAIYAAIKR
ncbi:MAG: cytochrome c biogenesis protein CcsA [Deferribacteraceae bacterium]|jgi:cytochrome c-type biogenesis protein CcmF|nr:cytochrome c biogenesis protein CcsA [Deferribacteraceae bacterium]